jgi:hypothetical protein
MHSADFLFGTVILSLQLIGIEYYLKPEVHLNTLKYPVCAAYKTHFIWIANANWFVLFQEITVFILRIVENS